MRTETINIYKLNELGEKAKETAIEHFRKLEQEDSYVFNEAWQCIKEFENIFPINVQSIDFLHMRRSEWSFQIEDDILDLSCHRLAKYIWNNYRESLFKGKYYSKLVDTHIDGAPIEKSGDHPAGLRHVKRRSKCSINNDCVLTGMVYDLALLDPIYKFLKQPKERCDLEDLIAECLHSLAKSVESEYEYRLTDESLIESIEANEYEFTENGELW